MTIVLLAIVVLLVLGTAWSLRARRAERSPARPTLAAPTASAPQLRVTEHLTERFTIRDARTGEMRTYDSLEQVPAELRARTEQARAGAAASGGRAAITVKDASGASKTYDSVDAMPPDVRAIYERALRGR